MAKQKTPKKAKVETPVVEAEAVKAPIEEVKAEEVVVETPTEKVEIKKEAPKKADKFDPKTVTQSTAKVSFEWSSGDKKGTKETMSANVAAIFEGRKLGKKVK